MRILGGGCNIDFGTMKPGAKVRRWFWIQKDGALLVEVDCEGAVVAAIEGYVTLNQGGAADIISEKGNTIRVTHPNQR